MMGIVHVKKCVFPLGNYCLRAEKKTTDFILQPRSSCNDARYYITKTDGTRRLSPLEACKFSDGYLYGVRAYHTLGRSFSSFSCKTPLLCEEV